MVWIEDENKRLEIERQERMKNLDSKYVNLPEYNSIKVVLKISEAPKKELRESKKKPGVKYSAYEFETAENKILSCFDSLYREIVQSLNKNSSLLQGSSYAAIEIHNKGDLKKPLWFVSVLGGA